jgi:spore germination cell wall hydrolase CwlJ-like protein
MSIGPPTSSPFPARTAPHRLALIAAVFVDAVTLVVATAWLAGAWPHPTPLHPAYPSQTNTNRPALNAATPATPQVLPSGIEPLTPEQAQAVNASVPISTLPNPAAEPFHLVTGNPSDRATALFCLTLAVYYEVGNQSDQNEAAVAQVVINRVVHPLFPKTVCGVVFERSYLPTGCAFSFTCDGSLRRKPDPILWRRAGQVAERALDGHVEPSVGEATHFHADYVVPYWESSVVKVAKIGPVIFYRWAGPLGMPASFHGQYAGFEQPPPLPAFDDGLRDAGGPPASNLAQAPAVQAVAATAPVAPQAAPVQVTAPLTQKLVVATDISPLPGGERRADEGANPRLAIPATW